MELLPSGAELGPILIAALTGGFLRDVIKGIYQRRTIKAQGDKTEAEATTIIVKSATDLLGPLNKRISEQNQEINDLRIRVRALEEENARLRIA